MIEIDIKPAWLFSNATGQQLDPQCLQLLQAIHDNGKLTVAAESIGYSYRHAWNLLGKWSAFFGSPLVNMERGRGARLTALGEKLLWAEQRIRARLSPQLDNLASELELEINQALAEARPVIRIHASHGYAVVKLREFMNRDGSVRLDLQFRGSLDALASLSHKNCDLAGFHVPEGKLGERTVGQYSRWLRPQTQKLIYFASRCQGLMLTQGNPKGISGIADLASPDIRFVNRQPGSGTRVMFDQLLEQAGIDPQRIPGYQDEEFTHAAVAAFVASGMADVGFGVEAAARQFKLDFIPVASEQYLLACHQETLLQPAVQSMLALLQSSEFKNAVNALPGYDGTRAGEVITVDQVFPWLESKDRASVVLPR